MTVGVDEDGDKRDGGVETEPVDHGDVSSVVLLVLYPSKGKRLQLKSRRKGSRRRGPQVPTSFPQAPSHQVAAVFPTSWTKIVTRKMTRVLHLKVEQQESVREDGRMRADGTYPKPSTNSR